MILAIDPGKHGGAVLMRPDGSVEAALAWTWTPARQDYATHWTGPARARYRAASPEAIGALLAEFRPAATRLVVEGLFVGRSAGAALAMEWEVGRLVGALGLLAAGQPCDRPTAREWRRVLGHAGHLDGGAWKAVAVDRAADRWPALAASIARWPRVAREAVSEAAWMAEYVRTLTSEAP